MFPRISIRSLYLHNSFFRAERTIELCPGKLREQIAIQKNELCISMERIVIQENELSNLLEPFCVGFLGSPYVPSGLLLYGLNIKSRKAFLSFRLCWDGKLILIFFTYRRSSIDVIITVLHILSCWLSNYDCCYLHSVESTTP